MEVELLIGPAIVAAFISALVTIVSWIVSNRRERRLEAERRAERVRDVQSALLADIRSYRHRYFDTDLDAHLAKVVGQMQAATQEQPFTPFVPRENRSLVWASVARDVHILPIGVIDPVVLFFSQIETISALIEDLRSDRYWSLDAPRREAMYRDYILLRKYSVQLAEDAERALLAALGVPPSSSSVPAPSDPKSASEEAAASVEEKDART
ncbi:hypothetical protein [Afifella pfennigii]|uniref:hypothetical protein n=1 Tax=Afifella pfennigii TaxID=209897 RepID=UPI00047872B6|nr:hypothetical protein [Afifella pfennigii]